MITTLQCCSMSTDSSDVMQAHAAAGDTGGAMVKIPIVEDHVRSLNLAVSVGVGLYEAIRQLDAPTSNSG